MTAALVSAGLLAGPYTFPSVRRQYAVGMWTVLYAILGWGTAEAALNGTASVNGVGLVFACAVPSGVAG